MSIESLFNTPTALPVMPKVVQQLILSFQREDVSVDDIANQLAADPVLSAKTLRLANSAYFHVSRKVANVEDALRMLGFVMVRNLVTGCGVAGAFKAVPGVDLQQYWRHSLQTACTVRWLAQQRQTNADLAFTVGLIHGVGQLVMHLAAPDEARQLDKAVHPLAAGRAQAERELLGYHHGDVGAELARRWQFPAEMANAMQHAVEPLSVHPLDPNAALVHIGAWRARIAALALDDHQAQAECPTELASRLRMGLEWSPELHTLVLDPDRNATPLPDLAELTSGMDAMLD